MKHRIIIVTVMLMAFLGQIAAASVVTCSMSTDSEISFETSNDEHSEHAMHNSHHTEDNTHHSVASDTNSIDNCCAQPGDCSMSGCMSLALPFEFHSSVSGHLTLKVPSTGFKLLSKFSIPTTSFSLTQYRSVFNLST